MDVPPEGTYPSPEKLPRHPGHNRKEITAFLLVVAVSCAVAYGLSRNRRWEMAALYVFGLGPLVGVFAIYAFRKVRCPRCRAAMELVDVMEINECEWEVVRCPHGCGVWRVEKPRRPAI